MSKQHSIRWRDSDLKELRRLTRNYNAKLKRQRDKLIEQDKRYQAAQLPGKASVRELKKTIETRKDFRRELETMQNFIDTGLKFKVDKTTEKSLHATVRDFNTKVDRLTKKAKSQGERAAIPEKLSVDKLLRESSTKENLIKELKDYKGFLKPGAEELVELPDTKHNIKITKWQKDTMERQIEKINAERAKELQAWKDTHVKYGGKEAGYTQGQARMDTGDFDEFAPLNMYTWSSTYGDIREKFKMIMRESQDGYWRARTELARINYTEKMEQIIGNHPAGKMLLKHIKGLDNSEFKRVLKSEDDLFLLLYELETHPDNYEIVLEEIWNEWLPEKDMYDTLDGYITKRAGG